MTSSESHAWTRFLPRAIRQRIEHRRDLLGIIQNTWWLFTERIIRILAGIFVGIWVARYLGPERLGVLNYAISFVALLAVLADLGLNGILVRDIVNNTEGKYVTLGTAFLLRVVSGVVCIFILIFAIGIVRPDDSLSRWIVAIISLRLLLSSFDIIDCWFQSQVQSKYSVLARNAALIVSSVGKLILIAAKAPLIAFAVMAISEFFVMTVGLLILYTRRGQKLFKWRVKLARAKELLQQSWPLIFSGFAAVIYLKIDQVMLGQMISDTEVGIYSTAAQLSELWYFIPNAIAASAFPALLRSRKMGEAVYHNRLQLMYNAMFIIALVVAIPITVLSTPVIRVLYGTQYLEAGPILAIHIWAALFIFLRAVFSKWLIAENLLIFSLVTHGGGAVMNVILNYLLIPRYKGIGAAVATVISYAVASYFAAFFHKRTIEAAVMMSKAFLSPVTVVVAAAGRWRDRRRKSRESE